MRIFVQTPTRMAPITDISQLDLEGSYSYADYLAWRFTEYVELIKGRILRRMAAPSAEHQEVSGNLHGEIHAYLKGKNCKVFSAPFDVRLTRSTGSGDAQVKTVVQPDITVVCDLSKLDKRGCLGAPEWVIEIVSPKSLVHDTQTKFALYAENGVAEYWIVFPGEQTIVAYVLNAAGGYEAAASYTEPGPMPSQTLPGLTMDWNDIFEELP